MPIHRTALEKIRGQSFDGAEMARSLEVAARMAEQCGGAEVEVRIGFVPPDVIVSDDTYIPEVVLRVRLPNGSGR